MRRTLLFVGTLVSILASAQTTDFKKAPNSYIYDVDLAKSNNYDGILIPVKKAYEIWANNQYFKSDGVSQTIPEGNQTATILWEDIPGLISNVEIQNGSSPSESKIKVTVNSGRGKGNAVVGFKVNGTTYWSWHVWVTDNPENGVKFGHNWETTVDGVVAPMKYMDRNLGATASHFLGNNWDKSGGLMYEWGRKDPFPALVHKDGFFYELNGESGDIRHKTIAPNETLPVILRPNNEIEKNIQYSVHNPYTYIINSDKANWFSNQKYKTSGTGTSWVAWDLWSDNYKGKNGNGNSSNATVKKDSRSYELKSEFDPCPNGWRVPSYYGRVTQNNNLAFFGRRANQANDDTTANAKLLPNQQNPVLNGIKVYPGLGMDFTNAYAGKRNIGIIPASGGYVYYPNSAAPNAPVGILFQDNNANGGLWSATFGADGGRLFSIITDHFRTNTSVGLHAIYINQTNPSRSGNAVRCVKDPNLAKIGNFANEYFSESKENYKEGLDNPNSYIITNETELRIPVNKAFSVYNQHLSEKEMLPSNQLVAKVLWTTNQGMIQEIKIENSTGDAKNSEIVLNINPENKGNAVISLHNGNTQNPAYWSWHIWNPNDSPETNSISYTTEQPIATAYNFVNPTKSKMPPITSTFMDRNLGAIEKMSEMVTSTTANSTKGLHYQWGRKDPIPSFQSQSAIYVGNENASQVGTLSFTSMNSTNYEASKTQDYSSYGSSNSNKFKNQQENLKTSVENPMTFLYQSGTGQVFDGANKSNNNLSQVRDWVSSERSQMPERWGHADKKSVYDPCPQGWRVPDVNFTHLYTGSKGNSPWYNSYNNDAYGNSGVIQDQWHQVSTYYGGNLVSTLGYVFENGNYKIGNFAKDGIRGEIGEKTVNPEKSGVWTASLADRGTGYALAMQFEGNKMQTGTGVYPQAAMGVRCMKDLQAVPFVQKQSATKRETAKEEISKKEVKVFPNPFVDFIKISSDDAEFFELYDMSGKLMKSGKIIRNEIQTSEIAKGIYLLKITLKNKEIVTEKVMKL